MRLSKMQGVLILIYRRWMFPSPSLKQLPLPHFLLACRITFKLVIY
uniref:Uncharacterized protein n=1 Tax=Populus trichocarpa TaxID=3694 RepID=A9PEK4_POPTR|nr:unknown [Populus trichocarpa]